MTKIISTNPAWKLKPKPTDDQPLRTDIGTIPTRHNVPPTRPCPPKSTTEITKAEQRLRQQE